MQPLDWITVLVLLWPAWIVEVFLHEASHAAFALVQGMRINSFKIWPHQHNGRWKFGRVSYSAPIDSPALRPVPKAWRAGAPFVVITPLWVLLLTTFLLDVWRELWPSALTAIFIFWTGNTVDLVHNWALALYSKHPVHVTKVAALLNIKPIAVRLTAIVAVLVLSFGWLYVALPIVLRSF